MKLSKRSTDSTWH